MACQRKIASSLQVTDSIYSINSEPSKKSSPVNALLVVLAGALILKFFGAI